MKARDGYLPSVDGFGSATPGEFLCVTLHWQSRHCKMAVVWRQLLLLHFRFYILVTGEGLTAGGAAAHCQTEEKKQKFREN